VEFVDRKVLCKGRRREEDENGVEEEDDRYD
jgi:hypothetical protein